METKPLYNEEAEKALIGSAMIDNEAFDLVCDIISAQDFYLKKNEIIWQTIVRLQSQGSPADLIVVSEDLRSRGVLAQVDTRYLMDIMDTVRCSAHVVAYAKIVAKLAQSRRLWTAGNEICKLAADKAVNTEDKIDQAESLVFSVSNNCSARGQLKPLVNGVGNILAEVNQQMNSKAPIGGLSTGFAEMDTLTGGLHPSNLVIIGARPSMGKTAFSLSLALNAAVKADKTVAVFSLEMSYEDLLKRMLCSLAKINSQDLANGRITPSQFERLAACADELGKKPIYIDDQGGATVLEIKGKLRRLKKQCGLDLVIIDYLQLIRGTGRSESRVQEISAISRQLKELSKELRVPIIALSQLSRGVESRQDKRPNLSDLRESGAIEQDADLVAFLYRDEYYNRKSPEVNVAEVIVAKHRNGPVGNFKLRFVKKYGIFRDLPQGNIDPEHIKLPPPKPQQQPLQPPPTPLHPLLADYQRPPYKIPQEVWQQVEADSRCKAAEKAQEQPPAPIDDGDIPKEVWDKLLDNGDLPF